MRACSPEQHAAEPIGVLCTRCHEFIFLSGLPRRGDKVLRWPIVIILVSYLSALFLVRHQGEQWPAYLLLSLTVLHLFALVYSKGAVIKSVALVTLLMIIGWGAWQISSVKLSQHGVNLHWMLIALWVVVVTYAFALGVSLAGMKHARIATLSLTMTAFIFGLWAVYVINIQYSYRYSWLLNVALPAASVIPMIVIILDVVNDDRNNRWQGRVTSLLVAISAYLAVLQVVADALNDAEVDLPLKILGRPATRVHPPPWFTVLEWKSVISAAALVVSLAIIVTSCIVETMHDSTISGSDFLKQDIAASDRRLAASQDISSRITENVYRSGLRIARMVYLSAVFLIAVTERIIAALVQAVRRAFFAILTAVRYFLLPITCFSIAALLLMVTVNNMVQYGAGRSIHYSGPALWGGIICVMVLVMLLYGVSLGINPFSSKSGISFNGIFPASLIAGIFWIMVTVAGLSLCLLGYALTRAGIHAQNLGLGPLLVTNLFFAVGLLAAIAVTIVLSVSLIPSGGSRREPNAKMLISSLAVALSVAGVCAFVLGIGPVVHWLGVIT